MEFTDFLLWKLGILTGIAFLANLLYPLITGRHLSEELDDMQKEENPQDQNLKDL